MGQLITPFSLVCLRQCAETVSKVVLAGLAVLLVVIKVSVLTGVSKRKLCEILLPCSVCTEPIFNATDGQQKLTLMFEQLKQLSKS